MPTGTVDYTYEDGASGQYYLGRLDSNLGKVVGHNVGIITKMTIILMNLNW